MGLNGNFSADHGALQRRQLVGPVLESGDGRDRYDKTRRRLLNFADGVSAFLCFKGSRSPEIVFL